MRTSILAFTLLMCSSLYAQNSIEKVWETDTLLKVPESVLFSAGDKILYVSNINGTSMEKDGNGSIGKVDLNGKIINAEWVKGLDAPKGLGLYKNFLYAADLDKVAVIDTKKGTITEKIPVEGAQMLNDLTIDSNGIIYTSDSRGNKVYRIENKKAELYLENTRGVNGLLAVGNDLYMLTSGKLQKAGKDKNITIVAEGLESSTDGLEMIKEGEFIVTSWNGVIYYVKSDGSKQTLLDTRDKKLQSADLGYDPKNRILYIPTFSTNSIHAYKLK
ncbi:MAG TPA: hypothetical protein VK213_05660 [Bacteroidales bacterium]|nr:hypothetical protein [Bacteroidales bacterium]